MKEAHYTPSQQNQTAWDIYYIYSLHCFLLKILKFCYISSLCYLNEKSVMREKANSIYRECQHLNMNCV